MFVCVVSSYMCMSFLPVGDQLLTRIPCFDKAHTHGVDYFNR